MKTKILIIAMVFVLITPTIVQNQGYWIPIIAQRKMEFKKCFEARLRLWGLQYDVTVVMDGKFKKDGKWVEFWTKKQRKELREKYKEISGLY